MFTLAGDRRIEWGFVQEKLQGCARCTLLDLGPGSQAQLSQFALSKGYLVTAVDLCPIALRHPRLEFIQGDFLEMAIARRFDCILNVSSVEHFGLSGRYRVTKDDPDADIKAMQKLHGLMKPQGIMFFTIPVGHDTVVYPLHRVYGEKRLPLLLDGYRVTEQQFWAKSTSDKYEQVGKELAMNTVVQVIPPYYALGTFVLRRD